MVETSIVGNRVNHDPIVLIITALLLVLCGGRIVDAAAGKFCRSGSWFVRRGRLLNGQSCWRSCCLLLHLSIILLLICGSRSGPGSHRALWWAYNLVACLFGLRLYLNFFDSYSNTYGSLGAVIILMLWLYLTGVAVLVGGELNAEVENIAAHAGAPEAKKEGEKEPHEARKVNKPQPVDRPANYGADATVAETSFSAFMRAFIALESDSTSSGE